MAHTTYVRTARIGFIAAIFAAGYLCGSVTQRRADAQLGDIGGEVMKKAGESGGMLGSAMQLGTTIVDMEKHVDGLQKNLDALKKVKAALGG